MSETRDPNIRWLPSVEQVTEWDDWDGRFHVVTYLPGWIDVRAYPKLAPLCVDEPPHAASP